MASRQQWVISHTRVDRGTCLEKKILFFQNTKIIDSVKVLQITCFAEQKIFTFGSGSIFVPYFCSSNILYSIAIKKTAVKQQKNRLPKPP